MKKVLVLESYLIYTNTKGKISVRFTDYIYTMQKKLDDEMDTTIDDKALTKAKSRYEENKRAIFKCKGCKCNTSNTTENSLMVYFFKIIKFVSFFQILVHILFYEAK